MSRYGVGGVKGCEGTRPIRARIGFSVSPCHARFPVTVAHLRGSHVGIAAEPLERRTPAARARNARLGERPVALAGSEP